MDGIESLLNELEDLLDQSKALPFSNKVSVDKEEMYEIIAEIRQNLPKEQSIDVFQAVPEKAGCLRRLLKQWCRQKLRETGRWRRSELQGPALKNLRLHLQSLIKFRICEFPFSF